MYFKNLDATPTIPLGTGYEKQSSVIIPTDQTLSLREILFLRDTLRLSEDDKTLKLPKQGIKLKDKVVITRDSDLILKLPKQGLKLGSRITIKKGDETLKLPKQSLYLKDKISLSKNINLKLPKQTLKLSDSISLSGNGLLKLSETLLLKDKLVLSSDEQIGEIVLINTVRDKYWDEPYLDTNVIEGKKYEYIFRSYNEFNNSSDPISKEVIIVNQGDITPPLQVGSLSVYKNSDNYAVVKFKDPLDSDWSKTIIRKKEGSEPLNRFDGTLLITNTERDKYVSTGFIDQNVVKGKTYYYRTFTCDTSENWNEERKVTSLYIPIDSEVTPPSPITEFSYQLTKDNYVRLNWRDSEDDNWTQTTIVYNDKHVPINPTDGVTLCISTTKNEYLNRPFTHKFYDENKNYYIKAFPHNQYGFNTASKYLEIFVPDITPPSNPFKMNVEYSNYGVILTWMFKDSNVGRSVKWIRSKNPIINTVNDGELVMIREDEGIANNRYIDTEMTYNETWYYKMFPVDSFENYNTNCKTFEVFTLDDRLELISDLNITQIDEELLITWTNPISQYFLQSNIYYYNKPIYSNTDKKILHTSTNPGFNSIKINIHDLEMSGIVYFVIATKNYKGQEVFSSNIKLNIVDLIPPDSVIDFTCVYGDTAGDNDAKLKWQEPLNKDWNKTYLIVSENTIPETIFNGQILETITTRDKYRFNPYRYPLTKVGTRYYFKTFTEDISGNINNNGPHLVAYLEKPLFDAQVNVLSVTGDSTNAIIKWTDPTTDRWAATKIVRNKQYIPQHHEDGEIVVVSTDKNKYSIDGYIDRNLENGQIYYYSAFVRDKDGVYSYKYLADSIIIKDTTPPEPVNNLNINIVDGKVELTWNDSISNDWFKTNLVRSINSDPNTEGEGYLLATNMIKDYYSNAPFIDDQIEEGVTYKYTTFTYDLSGNISKGNVIEYKLSDVTPPSEVNDLTVEQTSSTSNTKLIFKWTDPSDEDWSYTKLVYSQSIINDVTDGIEVIKNTVKDKYKVNPLEVNLELTPNTNYYFKTFTYDFNGNVNKGGNMVNINILPNVDIGNSVINAEYSNGKILILVDDDQVKDFNGCKIVRKAGSEPKTINDGEVLTTYTIADQYKTKPYEDINLEDFTNYYYKAFPYATFGSTNIYNNNCNFVNVIVEVTTPPVSAPLSANQDGDHIYLDWEIPEDSTFAECYVVKNTSHMPKDENDGELIAHNIGGYRVTWYKDYDILPSTTYYYRTFTLDKYGNWNRTYEGLSITTSENIPMGNVPVTIYRQYEKFDNNGFVSIPYAKLRAKWDDPSSESWKETKLMCKLNGTPTLIDGRLLITNKFADRYKENGVDLSLLMGDYGTYQFKCFPMDNYGNHIESSPATTYKFNDPTNNFDIYYRNHSIFTEFKHSFVDQKATIKLIYSKISKYNTSREVIPNLVIRKIDITPIDFIKNYLLSGDEKYPTTKDPILVDKLIEKYDPDTNESQYGEVDINLNMQRDKMNHLTVSSKFIDETYIPNQIEYKLNDGVYIYIHETYPNVFESIPTEADDFKYVIFINSNKGLYEMSPIAYKEGSMPKNPDDGTKLYHGGYQYYDSIINGWYDKDLSNILYSNIYNDYGHQGLASVFKIPKSEIPEKGLYFKSWTQRINKPSEVYSSTESEVIIRP